MSSLNLKLEYYDIKTRKWDTWSTNLLEKRFGHEAVAFDDKLYVFGGQNKIHIYASTSSINSSFREKEFANSCIYSVEMYSLETNQFTFVKPIPLPITYFRFCTTENCIYLIGGKNQKSDTTKDVLLYNTDCDDWTTGFSFPHPIGEFSVCSF